MPGVDGLEAGVVIPGVETSFRLSNFFTTTDDAPRAAVTFARGGHGVLSIKATGPARQQTLSVAKHDAIFLVAEGTTSQDALVNVLRLSRQGAQCNAVRDGTALNLPHGRILDLTGRRILPGPSDQRCGRHQPENQAQQPCHDLPMPERPPRRLRCAQARGLRAQGCVPGVPPCVRVGVSVGGTPRERHPAQQQQQSGEVDHAALHQSRYGIETAPKAQGPATPGRGGAGPSDGGLTARAISGSAWGGSASCGSRWRLSGPRWRRRPSWPSC